MYQKTLLSEKVAETILSSIKNNFYKIGDRMPNEIQLSEELGVSRATLREAIKILISRNILEVRRGIGTFVSESQGLNLEELNLDHINLYPQLMEIMRILKYLDSEELSAFQHLSWTDQNRIRKMIEPCLNNEVSTHKFVNTYFEMIEEIALTRQSTFKRLLTLQTHEAIRTLLLQKDTINQSQLDEPIIAIFDSLGSDLVNTAFDEFVMRLGFYLREE